MDIEGTGDVRKLGDKIVKVLNEQTGKGIVFQDIEENVQENSVDHLLKIPILLLQIVCLFFDGREVSNSQSKIYASIFDMLISRKPQKSTEGISLNTTQLRLFSDKMNIRRC